MERSHLTTGALKSDLLNLKSDLVHQCPQGLFELVQDVPALDVAW
jgi:hypothetical protein